MRLGLGLGLNSVAVHQSNLLSTRTPELLLQAEVLQTGVKTAEGFLVKAVAIPWLAITKKLDTDPNFIFEFARHPRAFEKFIAASYERAGFQVTLTPQRGDRGRDVIAEKSGFGSIRILEQLKAYSPGHLVTHDDIRAMLGTLAMDRGASKGIVTTTSDFQPGIFKPENGFTEYMPHRLELKNGTATLDWIKSLASD